MFEFVDYVAILKELTHRTTRHAEVAPGARPPSGSTTGGDPGSAPCPAACSSGVALAQAALVGDPDLLILDEPTVGLDPEQRLRFRELIADLGERSTVLLSTHQTEDVMSLCRQVVVLDRGRVRFDGSPAELAGLAAGRVWTSAARQAGALASWRTGTGLHRHVGDPPPGAALVQPSIEDGYLTLVGAATEASAVAGGAR